MSEIILRVAVAWTLVAMLPQTATAKPSPAQKCAAAKQQAAGKSSACQLKCTANAANKGLAANDPVLVDCLAKCRAKLDAAFAKADAKGGCRAVGDVASLAAKVDGCAIDIADDLQPDGRGPKCTVPFRADARDVLDAFAFGLDAAGNLDVSPSCGSGTPICCPAGSPQSPCGPLQFDFAQRSGEAGMTIDIDPGDPNRVDADIPMRLKTINDLPVGVPLVGDCGVRVDTAPGPSPLVHAIFSLQFTADRLRVSKVGSVTLTGLSNEDVALTGGIGCQVANLGTSFFIGTLTGLVEEELLTRIDGLCRRCCSGDIARCAP